MNKELHPVTKLSVFIGGDERHHRRPLCDAVLDVLRGGGIAGATVTKGVMSYGCRRRIHSDLNEVTMENLPLVIEAVDEDGKIRAAAARIAEMLGEHGLVEVRPTSILRTARRDAERSGS